MGNFFSDLMAGGVEGLARGVGQLAKDVRTALTGSEPLTSDQKAAILARADALEAAGQQIEAQGAEGQIELNKLDAASGSLYKGGWRPLIGWFCALGIGYEFLFRPIFWWLFQTTITLIYGQHAGDNGIMISNVIIEKLPGLDMKELIALVMTLLGMGGYRMYERIRDKA